MVLLGLVIFRVLWGLIGSPTARFAHFLRWPNAAIAYLRDSFGHREPSHSFGHNAAGGLMVAALIALMALQSMSGMASTDDVLFDGPLYGKLPGWLSAPLEKYHELLANILLALALLHIAVIIFYRVQAREPGARDDRGRRACRGRLLTWRSSRAAQARLWRALACVVITAAVPRHSPDLHELSLLRAELLVAVAADAASFTSRP